MSRTHNESSCGRGCWVCGDEGEVRRQRDKLGLDAFNDIEQIAISENWCEATGCSCLDSHMHATEDWETSEFLSDGSDHLLIPIAELAAA